MTSPHTRQEWQVSTPLDHTPLQSCDSALTVLITIGDQVLRSLPFMSLPAICSL